MNRKIGWVGDVIGLNFLRVLFENGFLERRVLTDLLISDGTLFRNVCEPSMFFYMIPEKEGTCLPGNCPIDSSLLVDS